MTGSVTAQPVVIAMDIGGTGMKCGVVAVDGPVLHTERHDTLASRGPAAVAAAICDIAEQLAGKARVLGQAPVAAGVAIPGVVDEVRGIAVFAANLGFRDVPLRDLVSARLGVPAALGHDMRAAGLAEARLGAGHGADDVIFVGIGTGIAAAHVRGGHTNSGAHGAAGELGHIVVRPGGLACPCGQRGCLETIASAASVARRYAEATGRAESAAEVVARAVAGEDAAGEIWRETVDALADGLLTAQALLDTEVFVIGGGLGEAGEALLGPLREALAARVTFHRMPRLVKASLGDTAGLRGAALLGLDALSTQ
ncbi:glucokinase [Catenuloplanes atrovinosus]|uniref:Glucokinase n=2 Tax=Catenuloplanes atrovinosus TaxID=137266 RepID=A0AAE4CDG6_9ACTN|nr:glucokinase [Catenuloplanes atrovinosus]